MTIPLTHYERVKYLISDLAMYNSLITHTCTLQCVSVTFLKSPMKFGLMIHFKGLVSNKRNRFLEVKFYLFI